MKENCAYFYRKASWGWWEPSRDRACSMALWS